MRAKGRGAAYAPQVKDLPELPAAKHPIGDALIYRCLVRYPLWNTFERVSVQVNGPLPHPADGPLIVYLNHPSWWDGYMCFLIDRLLLHRTFDSYLMMEDLQLRAYRFFTWSGAFSISRSDARSAIRSLRYISRLLRERPGRALFMFPQGALTPNDRRPIVAYAGVAHIVAQLGRATLLPVALRYEFRGEQRPEALLRLGPLHHAAAPVDVGALTAELQQRLTASADALRDDATNGSLEAYTPLLHGRPSVNRVFDAVLGTLIKRLHHL